jgi:hypothetical protein
MMRLERHLSPLHQRGSIRLTTDRPIVSQGLLKIKPIQIQPAPSPTKLAAIPRALEAAQAITDIGSRRCTCITVKVETISTPTFPPVFYAHVGVLPTARQASLYRHSGAIILNLGRQDASSRGLRNAGVVCEVDISIGSYRWTSVCGRYRGSG